MVDLAKALSGLISAALALSESKIPLLPVNPLIRDQMMWPACVLAVAFGIVANKTTRPVIGLAIVVVLLALLTIIAIGTGNMEWLSPRALSLLMRVAYVAFFASLGGAIGGALR